MIDVENIRKSIILNLKEYLKIPIIRSSQTGDTPPYPYLSYTITSPMGRTKGTYGEEGDVYSNTVTQTWSITVQSDKMEEALNLTLKAFDFFDVAGSLVLNDNEVIGKPITDISNRDNLITIEYEYRNGFDVAVYLMNEVDVSGSKQNIDKIEIKEKENNGK